MGERVEDWRGGRDKGKDLMGKGRGFRKEKRVMKVENGIILHTYMHIMHIKGDL